MEKRAPFTGDSGSTYVGTWYKNLKHGYGEQSWPDGATYKGQYRGGKAWGHGVYVKGNGGQTYDGMWLNDEQHGHGKETWQDGSEYVGEYMMGKKHG